MKRKILFTFILFIAVVLGAKAQKFNWRNFEYGISYGLSMPLGDYHGGEVKPYFGGDVNVRYEFDSGWSLGLIFTAENARREFMFIDKEEGKKYLTQKNQSLMFGLTGGYNFRKDENVNPFVLLGVGFTRYKALKDRLYDVRGYAPAVMPMVGVELAQFVRLYGFTQISRKGFNTWGIAVGVNLGFKKVKN